MNAPAEMSQDQQAPSVRQPKRWPLVSKFQTRNTSVALTKDAHLINGFAEWDPEDKEYWVYKRFGLSSNAVATYAASSVGCGVYTHPLTSFLAYASHRGGNTSLGDLYWQPAGASPVATITFPLGNPLGGVNVSPVWFETILSAQQTIAVSTGVEAWVINTATNVATKITNANYPPQTVPGWAFLNGTLYTMDPAGNIWGSAINDATTWTALNKIVASSNADSAMALAKQLSYIIAFKQYTTQVFYDTGQGSPGSTLAPVPDAQIPLGCAVQNSVAQIDNSLLWISGNQTAAMQVVQMDSLVPKVVSTPAIEKFLNGLSWRPNYISSIYIPQTGVFAFALKRAGHRFYVITLLTPSPLNTVSLVYDLDQQLWYFWTDSTGNNAWPVVSTAYQPVSGSPGVQFGMHTTNGNIYYLDVADVYPSDFGNLFPVDIYTPNVDFGTIRRKHLKAMYFNADRVPSKLTARFSDDDFTNWSNPREIDLNTLKPRLTDCGTFLRRRAYHFRHLANTALRIKTVDLQMDLGTL